LSSGRIEECVPGLRGLDDRTLAQATCRFGERCDPYQVWFFARVSCAGNQEAKKIARPVFLPFTPRSNCIQSTATGTLHIQGIRLPPGA